MPNAFSLFDLTHAGYHAPETPPHPTGRARLSVGHTTPASLELMAPQTLAPDHLSVVCTLHGIPCQANVHAQLVQDGETLSREPVYNIASVTEADQALAATAMHQAIELHFAGQGSARKGGHTLPLTQVLSDFTLKGAEDSDATLFRKAFITQIADVQEHSFSASHVRTPPHTQGAPIWRPLGGALSTDPKKCTQIFYTLMEEYPRKTRLHLEHFDALARTQAVMYPKAPTPMQTSLAQDLTNGSMHITLTHREGEETLFHSTDYVRDGAALLIHFTPTHLDPT